MLLLTFNHSHDAMHAETVIDRHSIKGRLIPTPEPKMLYPLKGSTLLIEDIQHFGNIPLVESAS